MLITRIKASSKRHAAALPNSNEFSSAVHRKRTAVVSNVLFNSVAPKIERKVYFEDQILNGRKQLQLMRQAMNSVRHLRQLNTPFEARSRN